MTDAEIGLNARLQRNACAGCDYRGCLREVVLFPRRFYELAILVGTERRGATEIDLRSKDLNGALPASVGSLSKLSSLRLCDNKLSGAIPSEIGGLDKPEALGLANNGLSGDVPESLGGLSKLKWRRRWITRRRRPTRWPWWRVDVSAHHYGDDAGLRGDSGGVMLEDLRVSRGCAQRLDEPSSAVERCVRYCVRERRRLQQSAGLREGVPRFHRAGDAYGRGLGLYHGRGWRNCELRDSVGQRRLQVFAARGDVGRQTPSAAFGDFAVRLRNEIRVQPDGSGDGCAWRLGGTRAFGFWCGACRRTRQAR